MSLIRDAREGVRKGGNKQPPDIETEVAIARYEYLIAPKRKPPVDEEVEDEGSSVTA